MSELRGHTAELDADTLGSFHVRWYGHNNNRAIGPFASTDEVTSYMTRHGLPRPDELLAPIE
ncbi:hypothetical protein QMK19_03640 [Streptomyces sp. H10-C2]|uniref:hypothetical protein n=1 Tax=unclassified Streptomyces TaxID=2593676 RepID=UPI0024BA82BA|nr:MULTISPECIES: hypothetical protein [unclassified Streptomyces]MDJ0342280.1 hypothetical protein [Streptomyces sp. PH10-H1]MDJ0368794.1 hypothetical protein [Streptomyces sp. H10-C2]